MVYQILNKVWALFITSVLIHVEKLSRVFKVDSTREQPQSKKQLSSFAT